MIVNKLPVEHFKVPFPHLLYGHERYNKRNNKYQLSKTQHEYTRGILAYNLTCYEPIV